MASIFIFFFLLSHLLFFASGDTDLIQKTCKNTKHYDLCVFSLKSDPTSSKTDIKGLAQIMARIGINNTTATSTYLSSDLLPLAVNNTILTKVLKECAHKYTYSADALQSAERELATEGYDYAYMHVSAAADYLNGCHDAFRMYPGLIYPPEIARREKGLKQICDVILGIIDQIGFQSK